jgi:hypothetical protein
VTSLDVEGLLLLTSQRRTDVLLVKVVQHESLQLQHKIVDLSQLENGLASIPRVAGVGVHLVDRMFESGRELTFHVLDWQRRRCVSSGRSYIACASDAERAGDLILCRCKELLDVFVKLFCSIHKTVEFAAVLEFVLRLCVVLAFDFCRRWWTMQALHVV